MSVTCMKNGIIASEMGGCTSVDSEPRSGRPSKIHNDEMQTVVMEDHRITVQEIAVEVGISTGSVCSI